MRCFCKQLFCMLFYWMTIGTLCDGFDSNEVTRVLQTSYECRKTSTPAVAVALVKDGQTLFSKGFGFTNLETNKKPVTDETLFGIASISKSFAATLFIKLLNEKTNLTLDSKVRELLNDDFEMPDEFRTQETTFVDMLSHRTAMLGNNRIRLNENITRDSVLSFLKLLPSNKQFRVDYIYNNLIYGLIGRITEILGGHPQSKKRWEDLVSEHLFGPLGMAKSTFATRLDYAREDIAVAYSELDGPGILTRVSPEVSRRWADMCASGSIMSSVKEMTNWLNFHLSGGKNKNGSQVMDKKLLDELYKPRLPLKSLNYLGVERPEFPITVMETSYAMGLRLGHYRGYPLVAHTGGTYGYGTYMAMLPTENIGAIILTTGRDPSFRTRASVTHYLLDNALGIEPYINDTTICTFPRPWVTKELKSTYRPKRTDDALDFKINEYQGKYSNPGFGNLVIHYNSTLDSLMMTYGWGQWEMLIWPQTDSAGIEPQRFYGVGLGPIFAPDMRPLHFIAHPENNETIVGFSGKAFDSKLPPIFCKEQHTEVCVEIMAKAYPNLQRKRDPCPNNSAPLFNDKGTVCVLILLSILTLVRAI